MKFRERYLRMMFYMPLAIGTIRVLFTFYTLIKNPLHMSLRFFQLIPLVVYFGSLFAYYKLFRDGVPVISLMLPTVIQVLVVFLFKGELNIISLLPILLLDIVFLMFKGIKQASYPFEFEGEETGNYFNLEED